MFEGLSGRLSGILDKLKGRGALSPADVAEAMREVRVALLEADVALPVVRSFIDKVTARAVGQEVIRSVTPGQMVVKIVYDELVAMLGSDQQGIDLNAVPPVGILMVGLQGSGKTTTTAKIARRLKDRQKKKVLLASLDTRRPAAMEQLQVLAGQVGVDFLPIVPGQTALQIARRAMDAGRLGGFDVVMLDTAGRTTIDDALMLEVQEVKVVTAPHEVLLVADALTGQDAVKTATAFNERIGITGLVLTRVDGDGRGGAALAMRAVTGKPIKLIGTGEKVDALEDFHPERIANRILGMGDIVSLVEKAAETIDRDQAMAMAERMKKGKFDLADLRDQLKQMEKLGGMGGLMGMMPGVGKAQAAMANSGMDDKAIRRMVAIVNSMTPQERANPDTLKHSRKVRIARGSGTDAAEINRLLKMHRGMADVMKTMGGGRAKGAMGQLASMFGLGKGGGVPGGGAMPTADDIARLQQGMGQPGAAPGNFPGLPGGMGKPTLPGLGRPGLPGLGGPKLPPGINPFGGKKR
jgi:signal recognition particle subunit SRP54